MALLAGLDGWGLVGAGNEVGVGTDDAVDDELIVSGGGEELIVCGGDASPEARELRDE